MRERGREESEGVVLDLGEWRYAEIPPLTRAERTQFGRHAVKFKYCRMTSTQSVLGSQLKTASNKSGVEPPENVEEPEGDRDSKNGPELTGANVPAAPEMRCESAETDCCQHNVEYVKKLEGIFLSDRVKWCDAEECEGDEWDDAGVVGGEWEATLHVVPVVGDVEEETDPAETVNADGKNGNFAN